MRLGSRLPRLVFSYLCFPISCFPISGVFLSRGRARTDMGNLARADTSLICGRVAQVTATDHPTMGSSPVKAGFASRITMAFAGGLRAAHQKMCPCQWGDNYNTSCWHSGQLCVTLGLLRVICEGYRIEFIGHLWGLVPD